MHVRAERGRDRLHDHPPLPRPMRLVPILLALVVAGCDSAEDAPIRLDAGTRTTYAYTLVNDHATGPDTLLAHSVIQEVRATDATVAGERGLTHVVVTSEPSLGLGETHVWYRVHADRLDEVAYGPYQGPQTPLRTAAPDPTLPVLAARALAARGVHLDGARGGYDSTLVRPTPRRVVEYPLREGRTWTHFALSPDEFDFRSTRTALTPRTVQTPAGARRCHDVRTDLFIDGERLDDIEWTECHDADGVVEARLVYYSEDEAGQPIVTREHRLRTRVETPFLMQRR